MGGLSQTQRRAPGALEPGITHRRQRIEKTAAEYQKTFLATAALRRQALAKWHEESVAAKAAGKDLPPAPKFHAGAIAFLPRSLRLKVPSPCPRRIAKASLAKMGARAWLLSKAP